MSAVSTRKSCKLKFVYSKIRYCKIRSPEERKKKHRCVRDFKCDLTMSEGKATEQQLETPRKQFLNVPFKDRSLSIYLMKFNPVVCAREERALVYTRASN